MNVRMLVFALTAFSIAVPIESSRSQGFAGLGSNADGFSVPQQGHALSFPADHGSHPDFRIEWWYLTANLVGDDGKSYGAQWTLFRSALARGDSQGFGDPQIWIGHAAVTTDRKQYVAERLGRGGVGQAGVVSAPFEAWIDDWVMKEAGSTASDNLRTLQLAAHGQEFTYNLTLKATGPLILQGDQGFSVKSAEGQASYYYSQPFYEASGVVELAGSKLKVSGKAWLDREWSSQPLGSSQTGWDWFSLHLSTGDKVMAFRLRDDKEGFISGSWISADGHSTPLTKNDLQIQPLRRARVDGRDIPVAWHIQIPGKSMDVTTESLNDKSWMATSTPYWEGPVAFHGSVSGVGYLEMTGY